MRRWYVSPERAVAVVSEPATTMTDVLLCSSVRVRVLFGVVGVRKGEITEMLWGVCMC